MKKCSKSVHHSLTELNITPLLDLAFVLLVIFIITTTPIVNDLDTVKLPTAAKRQKDPPCKAHYVSVDNAGAIFLNRAQVTLDDLLLQLIQIRTDEDNRDISVVIRGDTKTKYQHIVAILDRLQQANIVKVDLATETANPLNP